jgi:hypothetical protein
VADANGADGRAMAGDSVEAALDEAGRLPLPEQAQTAEPEQEGEGEKDGETAPRGQARTS